MTNISIINNEVIIELGVQGAQGAGVPAGGLEGQELIKSSDTSFDTEWKYPTILQQYDIFPENEDNAEQFNELLSDIALAGQSACIDLGGMIYIVGSPLIYPAAEYITLTNGMLKASDTFDVTKYIIQATLSGHSGYHPHKNLNFTNLILDANQRGGCITLDNYLRINILNCHTIRYTTHGILLNKTYDSHECIVDTHQAAQYPYPDTPGAYTGIGIQCNSHDNIFNNIIYAYSLDGLVLNDSYNLVQANHAYVNRHGFHITSNGTFCNLVGNYVDGCDILWEDPWNTEITNTKFLIFTNDTAVTFIKFKPTASGRYLHGIKVNNCSFHNNGSALISPFEVIATSGNFDNGHTQGCYINQNSFSNVKEMSTQPKGFYYKSGATDFAFDFTNILPFGILWQVLQSFKPDDPTAFRMANYSFDVTGKIVTAHLNTAATGTMIVNCDINVPELTTL